MFVMERGMLPTVLFFSQVLYITEDFSIIHIYKTRVGRESLHACL